MADSTHLPPSLSELDDLSDRARRYLVWAGFLSMTALAILGLSLLLNRSITRHQLETQELLDRAEGRAHGQQQRPPGMAAAPDDRGQPGSSGGNAVDGSAAVAEGPVPERAEKQARPGGVAKRTPRDEP